MVAVIRVNRTWIGSLLHPKTRLLPGLGVRLGRHPRLAATTFTALRRLPSRRLRATSYHHISKPLVERMQSEFVIRAVGNVRIFADPPDPSGRTLAVTGLWEWNVGAVIQRMLRPGDVFVDVGANAGYYTALAARAVGSAGHVYAIEPGPGTFRKLRRNLELNGFDENVTAVAAAAGAGEGTGILYGPASGHDATSSLRRTHATPGVSTEVQVLPLHEMIDAVHLDRLRLVKIDVEGHEDDVLRGLEPLLDCGVRPAIVVELHASFNPAAPAFVADFSRRQRLRARWIVEDRQDVDADLAPIDRRLVLDDLGDPPDLTTIPKDRYALILEPA